MIIINVTKNEATVVQTEKLTSGTRGLECKFNFSEEWNNLEKIAVCSCGNVTKDVFVESDTIVVPWEVMEVYGKYLEIGVYGRSSDDTVVIPTVYATVGAVCKGADPSGDESLAPTPTVVDVVLKMAGEIKDTIEESKTATTKMEKLVSKAEETIDEVEELVSELEESIQRTNDAAEFANTSGGAARDAAYNANMAADETREVLEEAKNILTHATAATQEAIQKTEEAVEAINRTNEATANAVKVTDKANAAANRVDTALNSVSNALKGTATGEIVTITDVSPIEHEIKVSLLSDNIPLYPYTEWTGIINDDNSIRVQSPNDDAYHYPITKLLLQAGTYRLDVIHTLMSQFGYVGVYVGSYEGGFDIVEPLTYARDYYVFTLSEEKEIWIGCYTAPELYESQIIADIKISLSKGSEIAPDLNNVKLYRTGKNLFNYVDWCNYIKDNFYNESSPHKPEENVEHLGENCFRFVCFQNNLTTKFRDIKFKEKTPYTFTFEFDYEYDKEASIDPFTIQYTDGTNMKIGGGGKTQGVFRKITFTSDANKTIKEMWVTRASAGCRIYVKKNMQIEEGTATDYQAYTSNEYAIAADGTVEGVTSLSPTTTLYADTAGVKIEAKYNRDLNKAFAELYNAIISMGGNV